MSSTGVLVLSLMILGQSAKAAQLPVPAWLADAIWYQVFVERFRNGDPANDPKPTDIDGAWPHLLRDDWKVTPWGHDWYQQEAWAIASGEDFYKTVQMRRCGGDLQGLLDKIDYLQQLGVTAIYLNPINDSPSLHKYDARTYHHVDRNFGPDPAGDAQRIRKEDPLNPASWQWTAADRLFLQLIQEVHRRDMRIIVDYSWNHTGSTFWAWQDVVRQQADSRFAEWYAIECLDDPTTSVNEFSYRGWAGVRELPEFRKYWTTASNQRGPRAGHLHPELEQHIFAVAKRWLDPNGDGSTSDGVDGFRLDVAELLPLTFLQDFARVVLSINPDAALIGELWWEEWPDRMLDPSPWIKAGAVHAVMNYRWFAPTRAFFLKGSQERPESYTRQLSRIERGIPAANRQSMMNVAASHDTSRLATSLENPGRYKFRTSPRANPDYQTGRPSPETQARQRLLLVQQFTWMGAPHIYYGDEVGMWGADDPDCRKPMVWHDLDYRSERTTIDGERNPPAKITPNDGLFHFYKHLIAIRKQNNRVLASGSTTFLDPTADARLLIYRRFNDDDELLVVLNRSTSEVTATIPVEGLAYDELLYEGPRATSSNGVVKIDLGPLQARILIRTRPETLGR